MSTAYMIIEEQRTHGLQPMDGEFVTRDGLFSKLPYADYDAKIAAFDLGEFLRDGRTPMRDETEDLVIAWWATLHRTEREEMAERGLGQIAGRWMPDEYAAASAASEAA